MALIFLSLAWVAGIWIGSITTPSVWWLVLAVLPGVLLVFRKWRRSGLIIGLAALVLTGGSLFYQSGLTPVDKSHVGWYTAGVYTIEGVLSRMPEEKEKSQALRLTDIVIFSEGERRSVSGAVLVYLPPFPKFGYGDRITVSGRLLEPPVFETFDWRAYLARDEVYVTMLYPEVWTVDPGHGNSILGKIYSFRESLADNLKSLLPEPQASLAQGLTLGIRSGIPDDVRQNFAASGTAHLLAISGLHLSIIAGAILLLTRGLLGRRGYWYVWLAMLGIWGFVILSGLAPPVVRGAVMASVFLLAELTGRQKSALPALCLAAAVMTTANPQLLWSASFQMTFGAMSGLIFLLPPFEHLVRQLAARFPGTGSRFYSLVYYPGAGLAVTTAAVAGVAPLIAYYFGGVSLTGGVATLAAMPVVPLVIFGGLATGAVALVSNVLAVPLAGFTWLGLTYLLNITQVFSRLPVPSFSDFEALFIWGFYTVLALAAWRLNHWYRQQNESERPKKTAGFNWKFAMPSVLLAVVLVSAGLFTPVDNRLRVVFLNVGQGDAVYIRTPAGQDILIDGGPSPQRLVQELGRQMPFWNRTIELVVTTHPDADHLTGLLEALKRYEVNQVVHSGVSAETELYEEWTKLIAELEIRNDQVSAGQRIRLEGGLEFEVHNPFEPGIDDTNEGSLVLSLTYDTVSFLFTADLPASAEQELIYRRLLPDTTVLKVAHHGSVASTSGAFLAVSQPELAVIQVGKNSYGHPADSVIVALKSWVNEDGLYRTDLSGTVAMVTDGRTIWLQHN
ncbi:MAG: DNA internalization-related competence protein ComEC/Rec2 [Dehalogenimonas sp.]